MRRQWRTDHCDYQRCANDFVVPVLHPRSPVEIS
jgi:hypothetical protein